MTKRARMTTEAVLNAIELSDDEDFDYDDPEEPCMDGSDDEFSDLDDDIEDDDVDSATGSTSPALSDDSPPGTATPSTTLPQMWSRQLSPVTMSPFQSLVGPTVPISETPSDVFELFFTTHLLQLIVDESNR